VTWPTTFRKRYKDEFEQVLADYIDQFTKSVADFLKARQRNAGPAEQNGESVETLRSASGRRKTAARRATGALTRK
jgi:hypothetical protein